MFACCDCRDGSQKDRPAGVIKTVGQNASPSSLCGIGVNFRADGTGALLVASLIPGGPAEKTGLVQPNDVLYEVDGKNVYRSPLSTVSSNLLGPNDSTVRVVFLRNAEQVQVSIVRAPVPNLMSVQKASPMPAQPAPPPPAPPEASPPAGRRHPILALLSTKNAGSVKGR
eukprot:CAMPEP_0181330428 /NCGR_PEP_ID=MMETSP1101-20121128/23895_1 /TAXON_ID=46948 /ORGANISM="Rhodomonas abbreviata, Strain Caron Lab Isolate" /LENGTH=169 /DNA_ID=CAMNT_0023439685 /DNA_START=24 /DNA_END=530 /DNA_ORIENTATION=-